MSNLLARQRLLAEQARTMRETAAKVAEQKRLQMLAARPPRPPMRPLRPVPTEGIAFLKGSKRIKTRKYKRFHNGRTKNKTRKQKVRKG